MSSSRIYIVYDYNEFGIPVNVNLWWRQPPRFFYDSKVVPPNYFAHAKLVLGVVELNDGGIKKHEFAFLAPNMTEAKYKSKEYTDNTTHGSDKTITNITYLTLDVNG